MARQGRTCDPAVADKVERALKLLRDNPGMRPAEACREVGLAQSTLMKRIAVMEQLNNG